MSKIHIKPRLPMFSAAFTFLCANTYVGQRPLNILPSLRRLSFLCIVLVSIFVPLEKCLFLNFLNESIILFETTAI